MSESYEREKSYRLSPINEYFNSLQDISMPEYDRIIAVDKLCFDVTGEPASEALRQQLVFESDGETPASIERMATYPVLVFGEIMEQSLSPEDVIKEYRISLRNILILCKDHNTNCVAENLCQSKQSEEPEGSVIDQCCPVQECVEFLAAGISDTDFESFEYQYDGMNKVQSIDTRSRVLVASGPAFKKIFEKPIKEYREKAYQHLVEEGVISAQQVERDG